MTVNRSLFVFLLCISCFSINAQSVEITREDAEDVNQFANAIREVKTFSSKHIFVKLIECETIEEHSIRFDLYILVKERTDFSMTSKGSFWVNGDFRNPRNYQINTDMNRLSFEHGTREQPSTTILKISTSEIEAL